MRKLFSALLCAAALAAPSAFAANLVADGSFSSSTLAAWTQSGDTSAQTVGYDYSGTPLSSMFNMVFSDGAYLGAGILGQQVNTDGQYGQSGSPWHDVYTLSFDLQRYHASTTDPVVNESKVLFDGKVVWQQSNTDGDWTHITITNLLTYHPQTWLQFSNQNYYDYTAIDNVTLYWTGVISVPSVPEPSSALMLSLGLGTLLLAGRAKRRRSS
ncbi:PEP-CTERM sorting domain-containing protein [Duganella sp. S19_KUP01_CR8]|uniref:PEP-CTERM sorting domain-containing protein n=1 Tax=Duganella sp. S19_KUP01_CR8 TaxID=3025502 RepID=UPI002FCDDB01